MRNPLIRLIGLAAAGSLILSPLAVAGPANAVEPGNGIISVKIVDDLGNPVLGSVMLMSAGGDPVPLGLPEPGPDPDVEGRPLVSGAFLEEVETGTYGLMAIGGWAGMTCIGLAVCSPTMIMSVGEAPVPLGPGAFTITEGATTALTVTVATPKLTGTPGIGQPLAVSVPSTLTELSSVLGVLAGGGGLAALGMSTEPTIAWNRNGAPFGATGATYTPTTADAGSAISATVTFPGIVSYIFAIMAPGVVPAPFKTSAVSINKITPSIKLSVPGKIKQGKRPTAYVNVNVGATPVAGTVTFAIAKSRAQQGVLRSGLATFKLPKLKPGKHKVTVSFAGAGAYNSVKTTKTIVVKGKKAKKAKGKKR